ncbi:DUF4234 domain-containing protein [Clostridium sp. SHJSY1]|uniref:DUF4234 domain-containing protein n=1 Tax=Clostridium sp. SHJSY1 TaxID=2942483 RepID=UPI002876346B|nr:DUF4234 domain-containing protein [Clostridium sp. SHJSY1]MDS0528510.1 DUF4234 domain-containing protein [Clostridium sp. SHJSY1]
MITTDRSIGKFILFSILTCGIYSYFFIHDLARDVNAICDGDGKETAGLLKLILFSIITCGIYTWFWYYNLGNRLAENAQRYNLYFPENGTSVILWMIFGSFICGVGGFVGINILIKNTNELAFQYNRGRAR